MCGIVGVAGDITFAHEKLFKNLLVLDSLRGEHSTGMLSVRKYNDEMNVVKTVGDPFQLMETKKFEEAMKGSHRVLLGHNRYATSGKITRANAHPFEFDKVIGVHNGTLHSKHRLLDDKQFDVDSENLYYHINEKGLTDALNYMDGAWSLVWWDKENKTLNFLRNKERPMHMAMSDDGKVLIWASEPWMIMIAANRQNVKLKGAPIEIAEDKHLSFPIEDKGVIGKLAVKEAPSTFVPTWKGKGVEDWGKYQRKKVTAVSSSGSNNVVQLPQNSIGDSCDANYVGKKNILFEVLGKFADLSGNEYFYCYDKSHPQYTVRLYVNKQHKLYAMFDTGDYVFGDINGWSIDGVKKEGFYKISPHTVEILGTDADELSQTAKIIEDVFKGKNLQNMRSDHRGIMLERKEWENKYPTCSCCGDPLDFDSEVRYSKKSNGDVFCIACVDSGAVNDLVNYRMCN